MKSHLPIILKSSHSVFLTLKSSSGTIRNQVNLSNETFVFTFCEIFVCVSVCMCIYDMYACTCDYICTDPLGWECSCTCMKRTEENLSCHSLESIHCVFWDSLSLVWNSPTMLSWLASNLEGTSVPTSLVHHHTHLFPIYLTFCGITHRSSWLQSKHFTDWVITPALQLVF